MIAPAFLSLVVPYMADGSMAWGAAHRLTRLLQCLSPRGFVVGMSLVLRLDYDADSVRLQHLTITQLTNQRSRAQWCMDAVVWWLQCAVFPLVGPAPLVVALKCETVADVDDLVATPFPVSALSLRGASRCTRVDDHQLARFYGVSELDISDTSIGDLAPLAQLPALEKLVCANNGALLHCGSTTNNAGGAFCALRYLSLEGCVNMGDISLFACASRLEYLSLDDCPVVTGIDRVVACAPCLRELHAQDTDLRELSCIKGCPELEVLDVSHCNHLTDLSALTSSRHLRSLTLFQTAVTSLVHLRSIAMQLTYLDVSYCSTLSSLEGLEEAHALQFLSAMCTRISDLLPLRRCRSLERLVLCRCTELENLDGLEWCASLTALDLDGCYLLAHTDPLERCYNLRCVCVSSCRALTTLAGLSSATELATVWASRTAIKGVRCLCTCRKLSAVYLDHCTALESLCGLQQATDLQELSAAGSRITSVDPLRHCTKMEKLYLHDCNDLENIDALAAMTRLAELTLPNHLRNSDSILRRQPTPVSP